MNRIRLFALAAITLSAVPFGAPKFRSYTFQLGGSAMSMVVAPLDADAAPDVAVLLGISSSNARLLTLRGRGDGTLQMANLRQLSAMGYIAKPRLAAAHLNEDDILDLGISGVLEQINLGDGDLSYDGTQVFPTFGGQQFDIGFSDINGDGFLDSQVLVDDIGFFLDKGINQGDGSFGSATTEFLTGFSASHSRAHYADLDGDGSDEKLFTSATGLTISSTTVPTALLAAGVFTEILTADFDGDGALDIAVAAPDEPGLLVFLNDGAAGFPTANPVPTFGSPACLAAGDITGDGIVDLVAANRDNDTLAVLENDGRAGFTQRTRLPISADPIEVELADLDGDGKLDIVVAGRASAQLTVLLSR